jgi:hypothetical protein
MSRLLPSAPWLRSLRVPRVLLDVVDALTGFIFMSTFVVAYHEYVHANAARLLGLDAYVVYWLLGGYTFVSGAASAAEAAVVGLSGGIACSLALLYVLLWWLEDPSDRNLRPPCVYWVANQAVYGVLEPLAVLGLISFESAALAGAAAGLAAALIYMYRWWS